MQQCQPSDQQVGQWLCEVWGLLQHLTLHSVEHIPLLPTSKPPNAASLTPLSSPVVVDGRGGQLSGAQMEALKLLGVVVVPSLPSHFRHIELQSYLYSADRHGTAQALSKVGAWIIIIAGHFVGLNHTTSHQHVIPHTTTT